uniref:Ribosomal-protein-alanine N-acetyltransferase n=1 Tax=candidate division WOR-3 bacterium TaxID=2052148 RepID=A0A7C4Y4X3_UNCW3
MLLGIDSSRLKGEITIEIEGKRERIIVEKTEDIPYILKDMDIDMKFLKGIGVSIGPGSFTGLRIGLAIAKGLRFNNDIPIYGIKTFDGMLFNEDDGIYIPIIYAKTNYVYSGIIKKEKGKIIRLKEDAVYPVKEVSIWEGKRIGESLEGIENIKTDYDASGGIIDIIKMIENGFYKGYILNPVEPLYLSLSEAEIKRASFSFKYENIDIKDLPIIMQIERESFVDPWDAYSFRYIIKNKYCYSKKAVIGDFIAGYVIGCFEEKKFHLMNIAVKKEMRKKGIGKNLIFRLIKDIEKTDAKEIYLEVRITNEPAINLYKMMGFRIERIEENYYKNGDDALIMSLHIK